jgi:hypothetical protein
MIAFRACPCGANHAGRIKRRHWMRVLFPGRALYRCWSCDRRMLIQPAALRSAQ